MSIGLPDINIIFRQKATTAIQRSQRGVAVVIVQDEKASTARKQVYMYESEISKEDYSDDTIKIIQRAFLVAVNKVYVITLPNEGEFDDAAALLETTKYNYVCTTIDGMQQALANYVITKNSKSKGKKYMAVVANAGVTNSKYVIDVKNATVTEKYGGTIPMVEYLPRITSILANLPLDRSITYYSFEDLTDVDTSFVSDEKSIDAWIDDGFLVLLRDEDEVLCGRGVNSLTEFTSTETEDMRKIIIVESMNLIQDDIYTTFKKYYVGKYKNHLDRQNLFISAVNSYFRDLAKEEILDPSYENKAYIDVEAQRNAWTSVGKAEAADWSDDKVKQMSFKSKIFLRANVKILDAMEDLSFEIEME